MTPADFTSDAQTILPELVELRRALHADPELGLDLPRTQQKVLDALEGLPLEITTGTRTSSVTAVLRGALPGPTVLLRGDMDALPIVEETDLDFASANGNMHACGHDLHTAGLVGAAKLLSARQNELHGSVIFMFQPGEEGHGGAKIMLEEGLLTAAGEPPVAAYAIHVGPGPRGLFATRGGPVAAGSNQLTVKLRGRGGHGSQPHQTLDPVPAAAELVLALQSFVTRRFNAFDPVVLSITRLSTGDGAINVIPDSVELAATITRVDERIESDSGQMTWPTSCDIAKELGDDALREVIGFDETFNRQALEARNQSPMTTNDSFDQPLVSKVIQAFACTVALTGRID